VREATKIKIQEAKKLVANGMTITKACKQAGIHSGQYYQFKKLSVKKPAKQPPEQVVATAKRASGKLTLEQENKILREVVIDLTLELMRGR